MSLPPMLLNTALSCSSGKVEISWRVIEASEGKILKFKWQERYGPPVAPPRRNSFGTLLLKTTFPGVQLDYASEGLICEINASLS